MTSVIHSKMEKRSYSTFPNVEEPQAKWEPTAAPFWSRLWFSYAGRVLQAGNTRQLTFDDLWELEDENRASSAFRAFLGHYERHGQSVIKATLIGYGGQLFLCELASLFETVCDLFTPIVLNRVITIFAAPQIDMSSLGLWLGAFFTSRLLGAVISAHASFRMEQISLRLQAALKALLFRKSMRCSIQSKRESTWTLQTCSRPISTRSCRPCTLLIRYGRFLFRSVPSCTCFTL
ncbi:hypothetical protein DVH05_028541 [Phytophthora capsici]|nr:hypothetical protein DVH05_028655 [Phytophthora capsici]KAG1683352.1 hypothetical protein DVH05_028603 [Phytophthora capsici]KAG1687268.1 hypothetical protein DVH05_028541 [Phytophthora capsici]